MSVSLTPKNDPDGDSFVDLDNHSWFSLTKLAYPRVAIWNGTHDPLTYTPEELRAIAEVIPIGWSSYGWAQGLEALAQAGGAILS